MEKKSFDFEAFKKQGATRIKNGDTLLEKEGVSTAVPSLVRGKGNFLLSD